jgi:hypothetical protein
MQLPGNARLGLTLYFKSPALGRVMFIEVDASPGDDGEVGPLSEGVAELTTRWCATLNRMRGVRDFRPATREEVVADLRHRYGDRPKRRTAA